jgi:hypothetical protein
MYGQNGLDLMPWRLCLPGVSAATAAYKEEKQIIEFLVGFRYGALQVATRQLSDPLTQSGGGASSPNARGHRAGLLHALALGQAGDGMGLNEFGYEPVTLRGRLRLGWEQSQFTADGEKETYWIVIPHDLKGIPSNTWPKGATVTVRGWLSPRGHYGMDFSRHELVAVTIEQQPPAPK